MSRPICGSCFCLIDEHGCACPEGAIFDNGIWTIGETESQEFIESSDFNHDVRLYLTGDFEDDTQRMNYLKHISDRLNAYPVKETDKSIKRIIGLEDGELPVLYVTLVLNGRRAISPVNFQETRIICDSLTDQLRKKNEFF